MSTQQSKQTKKSVPSRTKTPLNKGIYISSSRIRHHVDDEGLNREIHNSILVLRDAEPHDVKRTETVIDDQGVKTVRQLGTRRTELVPFDKLPENVKKLVAVARQHEAEALKKQSLLDAKKRETRQADIASGKLTQEQADADEQADAKTVAERQAKQQLASAKSPYHNEIALLSKLKIRFSADACDLLASTLCLALHELAENAMKNTLEAKLKTVQVKHAVKFTDLKYACLYDRLPCVKTALKDDADSKECEETSDDFGHYAKQICHNVINQRSAENTKKKSHPYADIKLSSGFIKFCSDIIAEFCDVFVPLLRGQLNTMEVKTVSCDIVKRVIDTLLEFNRCDVNEITKLLDEKLTKYRAYQEARRVERAKEEAEAETTVLASPATPVSTEQTA